MKYLIPVLFLLSLAMPLPAHSAGKADMSCVKGDCKKTDPAREAEKEMNKAAGVDISVEAPVEAASPVTTNPITPMQAADAIKEIEQAIEKETVEKSISPRTGSGSVALSASNQTPSCAPYAQQQVKARDLITANTEQHRIEQKTVNNLISEGVTLHTEEQTRISKDIATAVTGHKAQQSVEGGKSTDYQRQMREEGIAINAQLAANVEQHRNDQLALRCLTEEQFTNFTQQK